MSVGIEEVREYYNSLVDHMAKMESSGRHKVVIHSLQDLIINPGVKVLDLGCGIGISSEAMARMGAEVVAVDISDKLLKYAEDNHYHPNVQFLNADATKLRLGRKYDIITIIDLLEHIRPSSLPEFFDVLKEHSHEETIIFLNIPHHKFLSFVANHYPESLQLIDEVYTPGEILTNFGAIGFYPISMKMYGLGSVAQYINYVFIGEDNLNRQYQEVYKDGAGVNINNNRT